MSHPYSIFGKIDWVAYRHKKHPPGDILIKTWWALKSTYYKRVNEIAKTKFGKPKRNYKKLSDSRKKVVDSIFKKKYPHARMTKKLAGIKWPDRETLMESYNGYPSTTKSPTNSRDKRRCLTFFNNRKEHKKITKDLLTLSGRQSQTKLVGYTISFKNRKETLEQVFGKYYITPSQMAIILWKFIKVNRLGHKSKTKKLGA